MSEASDGRVAIEDVDDVIEAAAKAQQVERDTLSVEEIEDVARQLEIPADLVAPAVARVREQRKAQQDAERERTLQAAKRVRIAAIAGGVAIVLLGAWALSARASLVDAAQRVQAQRSQVVNVLDRQRATLDQWSGVADLDRKHAEITGAENRVRVERKRYDALATEYNTLASGLMSGIIVGLGDLPSQYPLSSEVQW